MTLHRSALRTLIPQSVRFQLFKARRIGIAKYLRYTRLELAKRRELAPRAGVPLDIGAAKPIVPDQSTINAIVTHWVTYGHAIEEFNAFRRLAPGHRGFVDIGAAEGIFSAAFCALTDQCAWAFEPSPEMFARLGALADANPGFDIKRLNVALGASTGTLNVDRYPDGQFSASNAGEAGEMRVRTLDDAAGEHGIDADLAKIDVEGMELAVLAGGTQFLSGVRTLFVEVHWQMLADRGESVSMLEAALSDLGFVLRDLHHTRIDDLSRFIATERELIPGYTIIVCTRGSS